MEVELAMYIVHSTPSSENEVNMGIKAKTLVSLSRRGGKNIHTRTVN
jgi:hypothetical protein